MSKVLSFTICIPSYNRAENALLTSKSIIEQVNASSFNVNLIIIDNGSRIPYLNFFESDMLISDCIRSGKVFLYRNNYNIGMSANFMKAFEIAKSDWLWLVSDDDYISPKALETIFSKLNNLDKNVGFIKFISERTPQKEDEIYINTIEKFIEYNSISKNHFNGSIFISNGIYKLSEFYRYIELGYQHSHTYVPHFLMLTSYINDGGSCLVFNNIIVNYKKPINSYSYGFVGGLGVGGLKTLYLKTNKKHLKLFYNLFFPHNDYKVAVDIFVSTINYDRYFYKYLMKNYTYYLTSARNWWEIILFVIFWRIGIFKKVFLFFLGLLSALSPKIREEIKVIKNKY